MNKYSLVTHAVNNLHLVLNTVASNYLVFFLSFYELVLVLIFHSSFRNSPLLRPLVLQPFFILDLPGRTCLHPMVYRSKTFFPTARTVLLSKGGISHTFTVITARSYPAGILQWPRCPL